jgi:hypothetical protein
MIVTVAPKIEGNEQGDDATEYQPCQNTDIKVDESIF